MSRDIGTGANDDRQDKPGRDRINELVTSMGEYQERLDARYRRVVVRVYGSIALGFVVFIVVAMLYQGQRWSQTVDACQRTNAQTDATINLLRDLSVPERVIQAAQRRYPHVPTLVRMPNQPPGPRNCNEYADEKVKGPKL